MTNDAIPGHRVTITFDGDWRPTPLLICEAPGDAQCKAIWDCDCEVYWDFLVTDDGKPTHLRNPFDKRLWCTGRFDSTQCALKDWFDNVEAETLSGTVTFEVDPKWDGENWIFHVGSQP